MVEIAVVFSDGNRYHSVRLGAKVTLDLSRIFASNLAVVSPRRAGEVAVLLKTGSHGNRVGCNVPGIMGMDVYSCTSTTSCGTNATRQGQSIRQWNCSARLPMFSVSAHWNSRSRRLAS